MSGNITHKRAKYLTPNVLMDGPDPGGPIGYFKIILEYPRECLQLTKLTSIHENCNLQSQGIFKLI